MCGSMCDSVHNHARCLLSPILLHLKIMLETLQNHRASIFIGRRPICNLRFADDICLMGGSNSELQDLTNRLVDRATAYGMEVSTKNSKIMTSSTNKIGAGISMNDQKLEEVTSLKYLGATPCKDMAPAQQKAAPGLPQQWQQ